MKTEEIPLFIDQVKHCIDTGDSDNAIIILESLENHISNNTISTDHHFNVLEIILLQYESLEMSDKVISIAHQLLSLDLDIPAINEKLFNVHKVLSSTYFNLFDPKNSLYHAEKSLHYARIINNPELIISTLINLGILSDEMTNYDSALTFLYEALSLTEQYNFDSKIGSICNNIAGIYIALGDLIKALHYAQRAIDLHQKNTNTIGLALSSGNIGIIYFSMNDFTRAEEYFKKTLELFEVLKDKRGISTFCGNLGNVYNALGKTDLALECFQRSLAIDKKLGNETGIAMMLGNIGDVFFQKKEFEEAYKKYSSGLTILKESEEKDHYVDFLLRLGKLYIQSDYAKHDFIKGEHTLLQVVDISKELGLKQSLYIAYELLSKVYSKKGDFENAYICYNHFHTLKEDVLSSEADEKAKIFDYKRKAEESEKDRQVQLARLQEKEHLLHEILPFQIAERIISGEKNIAEVRDNVSIIFTDIVGFTSISQQIPAEEVVSILNELYSKFDAIAIKYGVEKIKTIGDSYMAACGIPNPVADHKIRISHFAFDVLEESKKVVFSNNQQLELRIGIHSGRAIAGVIGTNKFTYDIWGDAVNTAARMESYGKTGKIHVSQDFIDGLSEDDITIQFRDTLLIKGKGSMKTYFISKNNSSSLE